MSTKFLIMNLACRAISGKSSYDLNVYRQTDYKIRILTIRINKLFDLAPPKIIYH